ncbi:MAG: hypothetical protein IPK20_00185 [Betaproteobacteria bacterium]|nr:hypothetical protein [Betaproteobacteria bacterium]
MAPITIADLRQRIKNELSVVDTANDTAIMAAIHDVFKYAVEHFNDLDVDAQVFVETRLEVMAAEAKAAIEALPESPEKRKLLRSYAAANGDQVNPQLHLAALAALPQSPPEAISAAEQFIVDALQQAANIIHDASSTTRSGYQDAALIAAYTSVVDDLLAATHLIRHKYCNQASNILRTAHETLEKAEVFLLDPSLAELWATGTEQQCWKELRPAMVRKRLGRDKHDPMYAHLSAVGTHASFLSFQLRSGRVADADASPVPKLIIFMGGTRVQFVVYMTALWAMYMAMSLVLGLSSAFAQDINEDDASAAIDDLASQFTQVLSDHMLPQCRELGADTSVFEEFLRTGFAGAWPGRRHGDT